MTTKTAIVWTKDNSVECDQTLITLRQMGYTVEERNITAGGQWNQAALVVAIPAAKTVPQIVIDNIVYSGLKAFKTSTVFTDAVAAIKTAQIAQANAAQAPRAPRSSPEAAAAAIEAAQSDRLQAYKTNSLAPDNSTQADRYAAKDAKIQASLARHAAEQAPRISTPQGYEIGISKSDPVEKHQARFEANKTTRAAERAAALPAKTEQENARAEASKSRIQAATEAKKASLQH